MADSYFFDSIHFHTFILVLVFVLKCQATLHFSIKYIHSVGTKWILKRQPWAEAICLLMCLWVALMHMKQAVSRDLHPYFVLLSYVSMWERCWQILLIVMSLHCAFLHCWQEGKTKSKRTATPWSNDKSREESMCPFLCKLGPAYSQLCFLLPGWENKGSSSSQMASKTTLLSNGSYRPGIWQCCSIAGEWRKRNRKAGGGSWKNLHWKFTWSLVCNITWSLF